MRRTTGCEGSVIAPTRVCELAIGAPPECGSSGATQVAPRARARERAELVPKQDCYRSKVVSLADIPTSHASRETNYSTSSPAPAPVKCEGSRKGSLHIPVCAN